MWVWRGLEDVTPQWMCRRRELVTHETDLSDVIDFRAAAAQCSARPPPADSAEAAEAVEAAGADRVRCVASSSGRTVRPLTCASPCVDLPEETRSGKKRQSRDNRQAP